MEMEMEMETETKISDRLYNFAENLVGNRVFDLYLKFKGVTMLTTATLVPVALILGSTAFSKYMKSKDKSEQAGGRINIPILDSPGVGTYLKLVGLYNLPLTSNTLVPLGILMTLYQIYQSNYQRGGSNKQNNNFLDILRDIFGNRVLDLFLKYKGITTLTPATLVPISLILGGDFLRKYKSNLRRSRDTLDYQKEMERKNKELSGGNFNIPFLNDPLIGNYLKIVGLYHLPINPDTLLPLGLVMLLYQLYISNKHSNNIANHISNQIIDPNQNIK